MFEANLIVLSDSGHRGAHRHLFNELLKDYGITLAANAKLSSSDFFLVIDDDVISYGAKAVINVLARRRTVGLLFQPHECLRRDKLSSLVKHFILSTVKYLPGVQIISIVPFYLDNKFSRVANCWIYDPQLWDLGVVALPESPRPSLVANDIIELAGERRIVTALGAQTVEKGFEYFARIWLESEDIRKQYLFVVGGKVASKSAGLSKEFASSGGVLIDRYITEEELGELYKLSHSIWACYSPNYDQASGIFGRAYQFGIPSIVRSGSYVAKMANHLGCSALAIPFNNVEAATALLTSWSPISVDLECRAAEITKLRLTDVDTMLRAFGYSA